MGLFQTLLSRAPAPSAEAVEATQMHSLKARLIEETRALAAGNGEKPSLEQYRHICHLFSQSDTGKAMMAEGKWSSKIYADLSGQDLSGFSLSEPRGSSRNLDFMDRDGDGAIADFYANVSFTETSLKDAFVDPATSFNEEIARAKNLEGLTFNNMRDGETFTFGAGQYKNIHMTNVHGGEIIFAPHSQVNGLELEGRAAKITIGHDALLSHLDPAGEFRLLELKMGKNAILADSDLREAIGVSMTSEFGPGSMFQNVQMSGNLRGLNLDTLRLNNVTIENADVKGMSFKQAQLQNVAFDGIKVADLDLDGVSKISGLTVNGQAVRSMDDLARMRQQEALTEQVARIGSTLVAAQNSIGQTTQTIRSVNETTQTIPSPTRIAFAGDASLDNVQLSTSIAQMERTVPLEQQASGANMVRAQQA